MVARFVEHQHVVLTEQQSGQAEPGPFAAGEDGDSLLHLVAAEEQRAGQVENLLRLRARRRVVFQIVEHRLLSRQAGVDVLGIDADLAAVAPADFAGQRLQRIDDGAQERRLALAVVADDRRPPAVIDFQVDIVRRLRARDSQSSSPRQRRAGPFRGSTMRRADVGRRLVAGDLDQFPAVRAACSCDRAAWPCWPGPCSWR